MEALNRIKQHMIIALLVMLAGIFAVISSVFMGFFGFAVIAFVGLLACSSVLVLVVPFLLGGKGE